MSIDIENFFSHPSEPLSTIIMLAFVLLASIPQLQQLVKMIKPNIRNRDEWLLKQIKALDDAITAAPKYESLPLIKERENYKRKLLLNHAKKSFTYYTNERIKSPVSDDSEEVHSALRMQDSTGIISRIWLYFGLSSFITLFFIIGGCLYLQYKTIDGFVKFLICTGVGFALLVLGVVVYLMLEKAWKTNLIDRAFRDDIQKNIDLHGFDALDEDYEKRSFFAMIERQNGASTRPQWRYHLTGGVIGATLSTAMIYGWFQKLIETLPSPIQFLFNIILIIGMIGTIVGASYLTYITTKENKHIKKTSTKSQN